LAIKQGDNRGYTRVKLGPGPRLSPGNTMDTPWEMQLRNAECGVRVSTVG
jgi:hypothetical protein